MSKYSVTIINEDGTNEIFLADNYKQISDKTGITPAKVSRIICGTTKFRKKEAKELLAKFKIEKVSKVDDEQKTNEPIIQKPNRPTIQKPNEPIMQNYMKFIKINSYNNQDKQYMQNINKDIYNMVNSYPCTTSFNENNIMCNDKANKLIEEIKNNITNDTLCVLVCNKIPK